MSHHPIVHVELSAQDCEAAGKFYHDIFGWEVQQIPEMNYATFTTEGDNSLGGGFNPVTQENPAGTIMVYINTDDIRDTLKKIEKAGGTVLSEPMPITGIGLFAYFRDLTGNNLALLEPHMDQK